MRAPNPLPDLAAAIYSACITDLPDIAYFYAGPADWKAGTRDGPPNRKRRPETWDLEQVLLFQQSWGSTALGFGGIGGAAMTTANVVIVEHRGAVAVYFGGRFAYLIQKPNSRFWEHVVGKTMGNVSGAKKQYEEGAK